MLHPPPIENLWRREMLYLLLQKMKNEWFLLLAATLVTTTADGWRRHPQQTQVRVILWQTAKLLFLLEKCPSVQTRSRSFPPRRGFEFNLKKFPAKTRQGPSPYSSILHTITIVLHPSSIHHHPPPSDDGTMSETDTTDHLHYSRGYW